MNSCVLITGAGPKVWAAALGARTVRAQYPAAPLLLPLASTSILPSPTSRVLALTYNQHQSSHNASRDHQPGYGAAREAHMKLRWSQTCFNLLSIDYTRPAASQAWGSKAGAALEHFRGQYFLLWERRTPRNQFSPILTWSQRHWR